MFSFPLVSAALATVSLASAAALPYTYESEITIIHGGPTYRHYVLDPLEHLSGNSPYFDAAGFGLSPDAPNGCSVTKAAYLVRHGAIYANDFDYSSILEPFLDKLSNLSDTSIFPLSTPIGFLQNWTSPYTNTDSQIEHLTSIGAREAYTFGQLISERYPRLLPNSSIDDAEASNDTYKIYTSSASRCEDTASSFHQGLFALDPSIAEIITISEGANQSANSLAPHESCPDFSSSRGSDQEDAFESRSAYMNASVTRLNTYLPSSVSSDTWNFTKDDVMAMQQLCGYETVIRGTSPFCGLFTPVEWINFEYLNDIMYHYSIGYGNPLSASLGMPWVNASTNLLLGDSYQDLYVSFTHREEPPFILTALGLFNTTNASLPLDSINFGREWKTSEIIPFLGHVALEKLSCGGASEEGEYVRAIVNSAPRPFPGCDAGPGASCAVDSFQNYIQERMELFGDFVGACGVDVSNGTDVLMVYDHE